MRFYGIPQKGMKFFFLKNSIIYFWDLFRFTLLDCGRPQGAETAKDETQ